jgi:PhzF family phenazine biosynthesis protein
MSEDRLEVRFVDAFTQEPLTGNPAGVVPEAAGLSDDQCQAIASELSVSETVFVLESGSADRRLRYFTPTQEVDLCGHATIGAHVHLHDAGVVDPGTHTIETTVGDLAVELTDDGMVWMTQNAPTVQMADVAHERVADALGIDQAAIDAVETDLPVAVASTGLPFLIVPVAFFSTLSDAEPDMAAIEALSEELEVAGVYLFTFDALDAEATLHARMFGPASGVSEDPVTGTASGAVGGYLRHFGAFDGDMPDELVLEQGHFLDRPGNVRVRVGDEVRVGGHGVPVLDGTLTVPSKEDDDGILEA